MDSKQSILTLGRHLFTELSAGGNLCEPDGTRVCSTLEDTDRGLIQGREETYGRKIYGATCIPYGRYEILYQDSPHFHRKMPYLQNVPAFTGIMFHWGNSPKDTNGCILTGQVLGHDFIGHSKDAFGELEVVLAKYFALGRVFVDIVKKGEDANLLLTNV